MALSQQDTELLQADWEEATRLIAYQLPNITPSHLGNEVRPERYAQMSGQELSRVEEVLADAVKQLKDEKKKRENDKDRPVEFIAVDNAKEAKAEAAKVEQERVKKALVEEEKARQERLKAGTANPHETSRASADTTAAARGLANQTEADRAAQARASK